MDPELVAVLMFLAGFLLFITIIGLIIRLILTMFIIEKNIIGILASQKEACEYQKQTRDILFEMANRGRKQQ